MQNGQGKVRTGFFFDTVIQITVYEMARDADVSVDEALEHCMDMAARYEALLSATREGSDVWRINHSSGEPVTVDPETYELIEKALHYSEISGGLFDPAIGALSSLWDFSGGSDEVPDTADISRCLEHIDPGNIVLAGDKNAIYIKDPDVYIDLGGIAKGYIADRMKESLEEDRVRSAIINLGGNVLTIGEKPDGSAFNVGIRKPFGAANETSSVIEVRGRSVVTSGIYERYFRKDGVLYHHILDPRTGYPADTGLYSVTIVSDSSVDGDAFSTICLLMGKDPGTELVESSPGIEAMFITSDQNIYTTSGW